MGAIIDSLTVVEEDANTVVENLEGIKSAVGKMVQDPDMNVLGIGRSTNLFFFGQGCIIQ